MLPYYVITLLHSTRVICTQDYRPFLGPMRITNILCNYVHTITVLQVNMQQSKQVIEQPCLWQASIINTKFFRYAYRWFLISLHSGVPDYSEQTSELPVTGLARSISPKRSKQAFVRKIGPNCSQPDRVV